MSEEKHLFQQSNCCWICKNLNTKWVRRIHGIFFNKNLVFIDSMQFINSSLDKLVENLSDEDLKYLIETKR